MECDISVYFSFRHLSTVSWLRSPATSLQDRLTMQPPSGAMCHCDRAIPCRSLPETVISNSASVLFSDILLGTGSGLATWFSSPVTTDNSSTSCFYTASHGLSPFQPLVTCPWLSPHPLSQCHRDRLLLSSAQLLPSISASHFCISPDQLGKHSNHPSNLRRRQRSFLAHFPHVSWTFARRCLHSWIQDTGSPSGVI